MDSVTQAQISDLLETGIIITNAKGQVLLWNSWMHRVTGITETAAINQTLQQLFQTQPAITLIEAIQQACDERLSRRLSHQLHPHLLPLKHSSDQLPLSHSILVRPIYYLEEPACLLQIIDVSNTLRRERHLREAEALLRFEKEVLSLVAHNQPIQKIWQALCDGIERLVPTAEASLLLTSETGELISPLSSHSKLLPERLSLNTNNPSAQAASHLVPYQLDDLQRLPQTLACWCAHPIFTAKDQLAGVLQLALPRGTEACKVPSSLLERSAQLAAIALQNHQQRLQVQHLAEHDSLTGLANRSRLIKYLQQQIETAKIHQLRFALFFIDLDGFKQVNDHYGHDAGDALLVELARRLEKQLSKGDLAARLGGDELVIVSPQCQDQSSAFLLAQEINQRVKQPYNWHGLELKTGASIGIALYPEQGSTANSLLTQADNAMYLAKTRGKGQAASCDLPAVVYNSRNTK